MVGAVSGADFEDPIGRAKREGRLLEGWEAIAAEIGCGPSMARKHAAARVDPLPVWRHRVLGIIADLGAVREWKRRGLVPLRSQQWWGKGEE